MLLLSIEAFNFRGHVLEMRNIERFFKFIFENGNKNGTCGSLHDDVGGT